MRTLTLIALLFPLIAAAGPTTQPARWVLEARMVEAVPAAPAPTTQPTAPGATLLAPGAKVLSSIEVLAIDRESFSAATTIGDRRIRLAGRARLMEGPKHVMVQFEFADQTIVPTSISGTSFKSNIVLTVDEPLVTGVCTAADRPDFGLVLTLRAGP